MSTFGPLTKAQLIDAMPERNGFTRKSRLKPSKGGEDMIQAYRIWIANRH
jgi:hypothetical protein